MLFYRNYLSALIFGAGLVALVLCVNFGHAEAQEVATSDTSAFTYVSPSPTTKYASAGTSIVLRGGEPFDRTSVTTSAFHVSGSHSGVHTGNVLVSPDGDTIFFQPTSNFTPGETVTVNVLPILRSDAGVPVTGAQWTFSVLSQPYPYQPESTTYHSMDTIAAEDDQAHIDCHGDVNCRSMELSGTLLKEEQRVVSAAAGSIQNRMMPHYVTVPPILPSITVTTFGLPLADGYLFAAPLSWRPNPQRGNYALIFDDKAELVYYQRRETALIYDVKVQPNGLLTFFSGQDGAYHGLNTSYQEVATWRAGNGRTTDEHDIQVLPNGHALLMSYSRMPYDLSPYGGNANATLVYLIIQEVDEDQNVYFEWNSLDHIAITDTNQPLTTDIVDYVHGNAIALDRDGNILLSSRHLSEITKINRTTGDIIWRLGGKQNQFTFVGVTVLPDVGAFSFQHDIRRLANSNISLFDNGNDFIDAGIRGSRGVEFNLDETSKTATFVREYRTSPDVVSLYMGNVQQLTNGNVVVGWGGGTFAPTGAPSRAITEFTSDGQVALDVTYGAPDLLSYRAYRFPWHGYPTTPPTLVAVTNTLPISLYYSWNGATEVVSYTVSGGTLADDMTNFAVQPKTGFEEHTGLENAPQGDCFFRVTPYDNLGKKNLGSNVAYLGDALCATGFTASPTEAGSRAMVLPGTTGTTTVTLSIDAGAVATTTVFALSSVTPTGTDLLTDEDWTGMGFDLGAYDPTYLAASMTAEAVQALSMQLTIDYSDLATPGLTSVSLALWDPVQEAWTSNGITLLSSDTLSKELAVTVTVPGTYALLTSNRLFFPTIQAQKIVSR